MHFLTGPVLYQLGRPVTAHRNSTSLPSDVAAIYPIHRYAFPMVHISTGQHPISAVLKKPLLAAEFDVLIKADWLLAPATQWAFRRRIYLPFRVKRLGRQPDRPTDLFAHRHIAIVDYPKTFLLLQVAAHDTPDDADRCRHQDNAPPLPATGLPTLDIEAYVNLNAPALAARFAPDQGKSTPAESLPIAAKRTGTTTKWTDEDTEWDAASW
ncbi:hypothetical protein GGX14DRAFT_570049 [Mycena pura]|uniref:Uncharacterized protein n=1 Tax=Mycena pura TaxID=153505 RepID=A0AAD6Y9C8_9AGAR|nr:hypothetical protein GGX14DRAFT_570049 [Mycena pura]